jgi:hypothetical protein
MWKSIASYSKNPSLASTAAGYASTLAFVEPNLVLPLVVSQFHVAMDTASAEFEPVFCSCCKKAHDYFVKWVEFLNTLSCNSSSINPCY